VHEPVDIELDAAAVGRAIGAHSALDGLDGILQSLSELLVGEQFTGELVGDEIRIFDAEGHLVLLECGPKAGVDGDRAAR
jgi:hypothetical protein